MMVSIFSCGGSSCGFESFSLLDFVVIVLESGVKHGCSAGAFVDDPFQPLVHCCVRGGSLR